MADTQNVNPNQDLSHLIQFLVSKIKNPVAHDDPPEAHEELRQAVEYAEDVAKNLHQEVMDVDGDGVPDVVLVRGATTSEYKITKWATIVGSTLMLVVAPVLAVMLDSGSKLYAAIFAAIGGILAICQGLGYTLGRNKLKVNADANTHVRNFATNVMEVVEPTFKAIMESKGARLGNMNRTFGTPLPTLDMPQALPMTPAAPSMSTFAGFPEEVQDSYINAFEQTLGAGEIDASRLERLKAAVNKLSAKVGSAGSALALLVLPFLFTGCALPNLRPTQDASAARIVTVEAAPFAVQATAGLSEKTCTQLRNANLACTIATPVFGALGGATGLAGLAQDANISQSRRTNLMIAGGVSAALAVGAAVCEQATRSSWKDGCAPAPVLSSPE